MLNVSNLLILVVFIMTSPVLNAQDQNVKNLEVRGIHLGDNINSSKSKMPCNNLEKDYLMEYSFSIGSNVRCADTNYGAGFLAIANHDGRIRAIFTTTVFSFKPDLKKIHSKIIAKYGVPAESYTDKDGVTLCYGECVVKGPQCIRSVNGLKVRYGHVGGGTYIVKVNLSSTAMEESNKTWYLNKIKSLRAKEKKREEANFKL